METKEVKKNVNVLKRYAIIQALVAERFEEGNQSKCKRQAYRQHINTLYPMGERTFYRIMGTDVNKELLNASHGQMTLNF
ncbi:hypothetical protein [Dysgonomonas sp. ZJ279]|uniref:hypothetical protein n=1 Tax=Dysgonomonas sp. ZJ279 TaxID=2709796 RepID=UPI0013EA5AA6|nr:hypothetical protein [Dysgonomonas sp. ZJ279]